MKVANYYAVEFLLAFVQMADEAPQDKKLALYYTISVNTTKYNKQLLNEAFVIFGVLKVFKSRH